MSKKKLVIATRKSPLALRQSETIRDLIIEKFPSCKVTLLKMQTSGDRWLDSPLLEVGGKGLFVKEIEDALLKGKADLAVHSLKDVPCELPKGLELVSFAKRADPRDVLIFPKKSPLGDKPTQNMLDVLPHGAQIGTTSLRRQLQLRHYRKDLQFVSLRGNVGTRLKKLDDAKFKMDAIVLAVAGLERLELRHRVGVFFSPDYFIPSIGQGVLALECKQKDLATREMLRELNHEDTETTVRCERSFLTRLNVGCQVPLGGYATIRQEKIHFKCFISSLDLSKFIVKEGMGSLDDPESLGISLAEEILISGGGKILKDLASEIRKE